MAARRFCCEQDVFQFSSNDVFSHRYRVWLIAACLISLVNYLFVNVVFLSYGSPSSPLTSSGWFMAFIPFLLAPIVHTILMAGIRLGRKHYILPYFIFQVFYVLTLSFCCIAALWALLLPRWVCDDDDTTSPPVIVTPTPNATVNTTPSSLVANLSTTIATVMASTISSSISTPLGGGGKLIVLDGQVTTTTTTPKPCNEGAILLLFFLSLIALNTFLLQAFVKFYVLLKDAEVAHYHVRRPPTSGDPEMEAPPVFASPLSEKQFYGQAPPPAYHISVAGLYDMQQGGMPPPPFIPEETPIGEGSTVVHPPSYNDATTVRSTPSASISTTGAYAAPSVSSSNSYVAPPGQWDTFDDVSLTSASQLRSEAPPSVHRTDALPVIPENDLIQLETGTGTLVHQHTPSNFNDVM